MRHAIPYEPPAESWFEKQDIAWRDRRRKLLESGHVKVPGKRIPRFIPNLVIIKPEPPEDVA